MEQELILKVDETAALVRWEASVAQHARKGEAQLVREFHEWGDKARRYLRLGMEAVVEQGKRIGGLQKLGASAEAAFETVGVARSIGYKYLKIAKYEMLVREHEKQTGEPLGVNAAYLLINDALNPPEDLSHLEDRAAIAALPAPTAKAPKRQKDEPDIEDVVMKAQKEIGGLLHQRGAGAAIGKLAQWCQRAMSNLQNENEE